MDGLTATVDLYCERTSAAFWAEPLNALSNVAFLVAASVVLADDERRRDGAVLFLGVLIGAIGIGSFLFHSFATRWASLADVLPIQVFIVGYLVLALRRLVGLGWIVSAGIGVLFLPTAFALADAVGSLAGDTLNGSEGYLPALVALWAIASVLAWQGRPGAVALAGGGLLFLVSLAFRTADAPLCDAWPWGTHPVWHVLNAMLLGHLVTSLHRHGREPAQSM